MAYDAQYPDFSWSHSRDRALPECARSYYWRYYGSHRGWHPDAPQTAQLAYALKHTKQAAERFITSFDRCSQLSSGIWSRS
jgi:hypothetical protein